MVRILLISGSIRAASTNTAALRAAHAVVDDDIVTVLYEDLADLPAFNPDHDRDPLPPAVTTLRAQIAAADGILFCTPEYAGGLPGSFKNLLDWTVGGPEMYEKAVAWIGVGAEGRGAHAEASLRTVLGYVGTVVIEPAVSRVTVARADVDAAGGIVTGDVRDRIQGVLATFAAELRRLRSARA